MSEDTDYALKGSEELPRIPAPEYDYQPRFPQNYRPKIGLIGCGGITEAHLKAYRSAELDVVALCDLEHEKAENRRETYFPRAKTYTDYRELIARDDIEVVDVALHPGPRAEVIEAALEAGKHVLSQKPFALDLSVAEKLVKLAEAKKLRLAVNQNGRWAPYVRYSQLAIDAGLIGNPQTVTVHCAWDHTWVKGTAFERIYQLILYDFAIHWVDMACSFMGRPANSASAIVTPSLDQSINPPLIAGLQLGFENGVANLLFDGSVKPNPGELILITGTRGHLSAGGKLLSAHDLTISTESGIAKPQVKGTWFESGFAGTMGELLCAIEEDREPFNSGRNNLRTLEAVFALVDSSENHWVSKPGECRALGKSCQPEE